RSSAGVFLFSEKTDGPGLLAAAAQRPGAAPMRTIRAGLRMQTHGILRPQRRSCSAADALFGQNETVWMRFPIHPRRENIENETGVCTNPAGADGAAERQPRRPEQHRCCRPAGTIR